MKTTRTPLIAAIVTGLLAGSGLAVAAQETERASPIEVSGTRGDEAAERCQGGDREARDGYIHEYGYTCTEASWTMSDPRLEGEVTTKFSVDFYSGEFADLNIGSSAFSIENDEGAWRERFQLGGGFPWGSESAQGFSVLDGEGAYEGLLAVLEVGDGEGGIRGFIFDGEFPPPPDNASTR